MIAIDMELPTSCWRCPFYDEPEFKGYCRASKGRYIGRWDAGGKPKWCPLISVDDIIRSTGKEGD